MFEFWPDYGPFRLVVSLEAIFGARTSTSP
jgi:hypothetical protein